MVPFDRLKLLELLPEVNTLAEGIVYKEIMPLCIKPEIPNLNSFWEVPSVDPIECLLCV